MNSTIHLQACVSLMIVSICNTGFSQSTDTIPPRRFEAASLGGVPGPDAMSKDSANQLFGYLGTDVIAFGEFTFDTTGDKPLVVFRLIDEFGNITEEHSLPYSRLTPSDN